MKKFLALALSLVMLLSFAACDRSADADPSSVATGSSSKAASSVLQSSQLENSQDVSSAESSVGSSEITTSGPSSSTPVSSGATSSRPNASSQISSQATSSTFNKVTTTQEYFEYHSYATVNNGDIDYLFHEPIRKSDKKRPLIIYLHNAENVDESNLGVGRELFDGLMAYENQSDEYSAYTLVPISPTAAEGEWSYEQRDIFELLIFRMIEWYNIDPNRIYIIGFSQGGMMAVDFANQFTNNKFAAVVPLSGSVELWKPELHNNTAFRIYHCVNDPKVSPTVSRNLYQQLLDAGNTKSQYIELSGNSHDATIQAVFTEQIDTFFPWLFEQRLP